MAAGVNGKVYSRHVQYKSSEMVYENKIPKSVMSLKLRQLKIANTEKLNEI